MTTGRSPSVDVYWSFRSPYSYLATPRLLDLTAEWELDVRLRPVLPLAIREPDFFQKANPLFGSYLLKDVMREAERLEMPVAWPNPDPVVMDYEKLQATEEQPHIFWLTRMGVLATEDNRGLQFARSVSGIIFGGVTNWHQGDHLERAIREAGCDLADLSRREREEADRLDGVIARNQEEQLAAGHWGVPCMVFEGEPFFGQDRLDALLWRLKSRGIRARV